jgi:protein-S-isoprenylcysteine O-methyltransferase Ste14
MAGLVWIMVVGSVESPRRIELKSAAFLMTRGPYALSRNPLYVSGDAAAGDENGSVRC